VWTSSIFTGQWSSAVRGEAAVVEPATGEEIGQIGFAGPEDIARAAARALEAQRDWARRSYEERAAVLRRAGAL
jgi:benzaldehyde dehydrogenase (NAD)